MKIRKRFLTTLALGVVIATGSVGLYPLSVAGQTRDDGDRRRRHVNALPPVGITVGETLRVTFLNLGNDSFVINPCFLNADGAVVKEGAPLTIGPGQFRSFDLTHSEAGVPGGTGGRVQVRVVVSPVPDDGRTVDRVLRGLVVTGEVMELTGKSSLYVSGLTARAGVEPQPF